MSNKRIKTEEYWMKYKTIFHDRFQEMKSSNIKYDTKSNSTKLDLASKQQSSSSLEVS